MCFGPKICCGPDIGCLIDTRESIVCSTEDVKSSKPCAPYGDSCEAVNYGRCATKSLCCNPGKKFKSFAYMYMMLNYLLIFPK